MKYALLIYADETDKEITPGPEDPGFGEMMAGYMAFGEVVTPSMTAGEALHETTMATSVRVRDGETVTTDGPFAETKEHLGGFYIVDCENLDQAVALAAQIPHAKNGTVEVRPVMEFD